MKMLRHSFHQMPLMVPLILCVTLGLAPFRPEPHLVEKLRMLAGGALTAPIDIFDLVLHAAPFVLLLLKLTIRPAPES